MAQPVVTDSITFKVLIVGSFGIGKTTLIEEISQVPVVGTEVVTTGTEADVKPTTTVGVEYGLFSIGEGDSLVTLLLFGTPGQDRFFITRDVAARGIDGLIIIVNADEPDTWMAGRSLYEAYNEDKVLPTAVVVNREVSGAEPPAELARTIGIAPERTVISCGNVTDAGDARRFVVDLLSLILEIEFGEEDQQDEADDE